MLVPHASRRKPCGSSVTRSTCPCPAPRDAPMPAPAAHRHTAPPPRAPAPAMQAPHRNASMLFIAVAQFYDQIHRFWKHKAVLRITNRLFIFLFLSAALGGALNKLALLPQSVGVLFPSSPFAAIQLAFTLILIQEAVGLVLAIAGSVSRAVGKQLEIMALIMIRECFTDIGQLEAQRITADDYFVLLQIASTAVAGLLLFIFRGIFLQLHTSRGYTNMEEYINAKKSVSVILLCILVCIVCYDMYNIIFQGGVTNFFKLFYTALIFTDILLVLVSQYYLGSFHDTFRYSSYAACTLFMRTSLGAPHYIGALLCVLAGVLLLVLTWATRRWQPVS